MNNYIKDMIQNAKEETNKDTMYAKETYKNFKKDIELFKMVQDQLPELTDTESKLISASGKNVVISGHKKSFDMTPFTYTGSNFYYRNERCRIENCNGQHGSSEDFAIAEDRIGNQGFFIVTDVIELITDSETNEIIFENKFTDQPLCIQKALLFGKEVGLKFIRDFEDYYNTRINDNLEVFNAYCNAVRDVVIPLIEQGEKITYPERMQKWTEYVCKEFKFNPSACTNLQRFNHWLNRTQTDISNVIENIKVVNSEKNLRKIAKKLDNDKDYSVSKQILHFSKKGPEFAKLQSNPLDKHLIDAIESENKSFESKEK